MAESNNGDLLSSVKEEKNQLIDSSISPKPDQANNNANPDRDALQPTIHTQTWTTPKPEPSYPPLSSLVPFLVVFSLRSLYSHIPLSFIRKAEELLAYIHNLLLRSSWFQILFVCVLFSTISTFIIFLSVSIVVLWPLLLSFVSVFSYFLTIFSVFISTTTLVERQYDWILLTLTLQVFTCVPIYLFGPLFLFFLFSLSLYMLIFSHIPTSTYLYKLLFFPVIFFMMMSTPYWGFFWYICVPLQITLFFVCECLFFTAYFFMVNVYDMDEVKQWITNMGEKGEIKMYLTKENVTSVYEYAVFNVNNAVNWAISKIPFSTEFGFNKALNERPPAVPLPIASPVLRKPHSN